MRKCIQCINFHGVLETNSEQIMDFLILIEYEYLKYLWNNFPFFKFGN